MGRNFDSNNQLKKKQVAYGNRIKKKNKKDLAISKIWLDDKKKLAG
jgi:hypothetical protein